MILIGNLGMFPSWRKKMRPKNLLFIASSFVIAFSLVSTGMTADKVSPKTAEKKTITKKDSAKKKAKRTKASGTSFHGRIIFLGADGCEIKYGKREVTVTFAQDTLFIAKDGSKKDKAILELCQMVKIAYVKKGKQNILKKIVIVKQGNCVK